MEMVFSARFFCSNFCSPASAASSFPKLHSSNFSWSQAFSIPSSPSSQSLSFRIVPFPSSFPSHKPPFLASSARAETAQIEPATKVQFQRSIVAPGGSESLSLVGTGYREKSIAFISVKVYAVGLYLGNGVSASLVPWKGKGGNELAKDESFFKAIVEAPVEKAIKIVLVRDVDGATFWGALDEALTPRLKAVNAGAAGQEALDAFGKVFRGKSLKKGTSIYLTWTQPSTLQVALSRDDLISATLEAAINSTSLVSALYDVYLGEAPVSPTAKASIAAGLAALL